jgi:hypothetical protein
MNDSLWSLASNTLRVYYQISCKCNLQTSKNSCLLGCYALSPGKVTEVSKKRSSNETSVTVYQATGRNIPEDLDLPVYYCEKPKYRTGYIS